MTDQGEKFREDVALFRYGVVSELLRCKPATPEYRAKLLELSQQAWVIPGSTRTRIARQTLRDWVRAYRSGGFDALRPKRRRDSGKPRRMSVEAIELLLAVKRAEPALSVRQAIARARDSGDVPGDMPLPTTTVHRLFTNEGVMDMAPPGPPADRRRFAWPWAGDLWMSDVMHGPRVPGDRGRKHKTYLIALLDDATRVIPYAAFHPTETTPAFLQVLKQGILRRGRPVRLYVDNGANYRSRQVALVCARLDIALIHARPYQPSGKGKIERFFRTLRQQFLAGLDDGAMASLEALNRNLHGWIEGEYHHNPHRGLDGMTPLEKWARAADSVRYVDPGDAGLDALFLFEAVRRVYRDRTVRLNSRIYEVDAALAGKKVTLHYDPTLPATRPIKVTLDGSDAGEARPVDLEANARGRRAAPPPIPFTKPNRDKS